MQNFLVNVTIKHISGSLKGLKTVQTYTTIQSGIVLEKRKIGETYRTLQNTKYEVISIDIIAHP
tara:strand:- start:1522 stop:1713 length:192 start_codon:yes stop_codon:yes gene_type:complete